MTFNPHLFLSSVSIQWNSDNHKCISSKIFFCLLSIYFTIFIVIFLIYRFPHFRFPKLRLPHLRLPNHHVPDHRNHPPKTSICIIVSVTARLVKEWHMSWLGTTRHVYPIMLSPCDIPECHKAVACIRTTTNRAGLCVVSYRSHILLMAFWPR